MNIADVIEVLPPKTPDAWKAPLTDELRAFVPLAQRLFVDGQRVTDDSKGTFKKFVDLSDAAKEERRKIFDLNGSLPDDLLSNVPYAWFNQGYGYVKKHATSWVEELTGTPKTTMAEARKIADVLGFLVLPFAYLDPRSYASEDTTMKKAIARFSVVGGEQMSCYVLCPIAYYDLDRHIDAKVDLPIHVPPQAAQAFMAVDMTIPMFRQMRAQLKVANAGLETMNVQIKSTQQRIKDLEGVVAQILQDQARQRAEQARLEAEQERQRAEAEELRRQVAALEARRWVAWEPMMLLFPSARTVRDDGWAAIGPCWGPDFDDIVMAAAGLTKGIDRKPNQRKWLNDQAMKFGT